MLRIDKDSNITIMRGDTGTILVDLKDADERDYTLKTNDEVWLTVKESSATENIIFQYRLAGKTFTFKESDTKKLEPGVYNYDVQVRLIEYNIVDTVLKGKLKVIADITTNQ